MIRKQRYFYVLIGAVMITWLLSWKLHNSSFNTKLHSSGKSEAASSTVTSFLSRNTDCLVNDIEKITTNTSVINLDTYSGNCKVLVRNNTKISQAPFKIYIYNLPSQFNADLVKCTQNLDGSCYHPDYCGYGPELYSDLDLSVRNSWQFSLEVIMHHKLLVSPYRTLDPEEADAFYVPYYSGLDCLCHQDSLAPLKTNIREIGEFIQKQTWAGTQKKPHIMTLGKIEREHFSTSCSLLLLPELQDFHLIGIEEEINEEVRLIRRKTSMPLILAPYPTYGHLNSMTKMSAYKKSLFQTKRNIFLLLAAGTRRSNFFRRKLFDQFPNTTAISYKDHMAKLSSTRPGFESRWFESMWLETPECRGRHELYTMEWMKQSVFCLQPPGDSPTRKSFFDAIISGCIPVTFSDVRTVRYPFQAKLNYTSFTITIKSDLIEHQHRTVVDILHQVSKSKIHELQQNLLQVITYMQYSYPITNQLTEDAFQMVLNELQERMK